MSSFRKTNTRTILATICIVLATTLMACTNSETVRPPNTATDPYAPAPVDWSCENPLTLMKCQDYQNWYTALPWAGPTRPVEFQRGVARRLAVAVYGAGMYGQPGLRQSIEDSLMSTDPRCVAKVIRDAAYTIARNRDGKLDALKQMVSLAIRVPGGFVGGQAIKTVYRFVFNSAQDAVRTSLDVDFASMGLNKMVEECD